MIDVWWFNVFLFQVREITLHGIVESVNRNMRTDIVWCMETGGCGGDRAHLSVWNEKHSTAWYIEVQQELMRVWADPALRTETCALGFWFTSAARVRYDLTPIQRSRNF